MLELSGYAKNTDDFPYMTFANRNTPCLVCRFFTHSDRFVFETGIEPEETGMNSSPRLWAVCRAGGIFLTDIANCRFQKSREVFHEIRDVIPWVYQ